MACCKCVWCTMRAILNISVKLTKRGIILLTGWILLSYTSSLTSVNIVYTTRDISSFLTCSNHISKCLYIEVFVHLRVLGKLDEGITAETVSPSCLIHLSEQSQ